MPQDDIMQIKLPKKGGQIKVLMGDYGYWPIAVK